MDDRLRLRRLFFVLRELGVVRDDGERLAIRRPVEIDDTARKVGELFGLAPVRGQ